LEGKQQDEAAGEILDKVDAVGLNTALSVVPKHPYHVVKEE
jgi:hypothetical protein